MAFDMAHAAIHTSVLLYAGVSLFRLHNNKPGGAGYDSRIARSEAYNYAGQP